MYNLLIPRETKELEKQIPYICSEHFELIRRKMYN